MAFDQAFITALQLSIVPVMIMVALAAISYMLSKLVNYKEFEIFAKIELYQILISIVIILFVIFGTQAIFEITTQIAGGDPFEIALTYLENLIRESFNAIKIAFGGRMGITVSSALNMKIGLDDIPAINQLGLPLRADISYPPLDLSTLGKGLDKLFLIIFPFFSSLAVQQFALSIIQAIMIPFVLPVGIFLRIFPPTRQSGAFLIAVAIGFYVVFPFTYVVHAATVESISETIRTETQDGLKDIIENSTDGYSGVYVSTWNKIFGLLGPKIYNLFEGIITFSLVLLQGLFLPTISMAITLGFIKSFEKFLVQRFD